MCRKSEEEYSEQKENTFKTRFFGNEERERIAAAETMISIRSEESSTEKRKKSRIAARKTRERKTKLLMEIQDRVWTLTKSNDEMQKRLETATIILEKILEEVDISIANRKVDMYRIAYLLLAASPHFFFSAKHRYLMQKLRSFFYNSA